MNVSSATGGPSAPGRAALRIDKSVRDPSLDFVRAILIIMMVMYHVRYMGSLTGGISSIIYETHIFRMPVFLMISGFLFHPLLSSTRINKFIRVLVVPYILFISAYLTALFLAARTGMSTSNAPISDIFGFVNSIFLQPYGAYWFIHNIIVMQIIVTFATFINNKLWGSMLVIPIMTLAICIAIKIGAPLKIETESLIFFMLGWFVRAAGWEFPRDIKIGVIFLCVGYLLLAKNANAEIAQIIITVGALTVLIWAGDNLKTTSFGRIMIGLGRNTLIVVLAHAAFIFLINAIAARVIVIDPTGILHLAVSTIFGLGGPLVLGIMLDRLRLAPWIFGKSRITEPVPEARAG